MELKIRTGIGLWDRSVVGGGAVAGNKAGRVNFSRVGIRTGVKN